MRCIGIGASAGGVQALQHFLSGLRKDFSWPIIVVHHLPADAEIDPSLAFSKPFGGEALVVNDKMPIEPGKLYFAAPGYHLLVEKDFTFALSQDDMVNFSRPSIDVFFESFAEVFGSNACGILLTGANADGAEGMRTIQKVGGLTFVEDPRYAEAKAMPAAALALIDPNFVGSPEEIAAKVSEIEERGPR